MKLKLSAPKNITFWVAVVLALIGLIAFFGVIPGFGVYSFWLVLVGFVVLALGNTMKGM